MRRLSLMLGLALALSFVASQASAQFGTARGRVTDEEGKPLANAKVTISSTDDVRREYQVDTDAKGEYVQVGLRTAVYRITATKEGFQGAYTEYKIRMGTSTSVPDLVLKPAAVAAEQLTAQRLAATQTAFAEAVALTDAEKWDEAVAAFEKLLEEDPDLPEAYHNLGFIHSRRQQWEAARDAYQQALARRPDYDEAKLALANTLRKLGEAEKADALLAEAAAAGENAEAHYAMGVNLMNENKVPEAVVAFERALAISPDLQDARFHLGKLLIGQGRVPEAIDHLEKYLATKPDNAQNVAVAEQLLAAFKPGP